MLDILSRVRIVLVNTSHPGNIGGVARAMKNMGLMDLCLVSPQEFPSDAADARSSGAVDVLLNATVVDNLPDALVDCRLVLGTSARNRHIPWPLVNPRQAAQQIVLAVADVQSVLSDSAEAPKVAVVFGREDRGLTNDELHQCHAHVHIPTNEVFSSLNLAAAVQVVAYEVRMAVIASSDVNATDGEAESTSFWGTDWDIELASHDELERMFAHMQTTLKEINFLDPKNPRQLMTRMRRLYLRSRPDRVEVNVIRGILTATQKANANCQRED